MAAQETLPMVLPEKPERSLTPMDLLQVALSNNAAIDVIERLAALQEKSLAKQSEQSFFRALHLAQQEVPSIEPNKEVKTSGGKLMFKYSSYEQLDKVLRPIYVKHGMSISFSGAEAPAGKVRVLCRVFHRDGHSEPYQLDLAIDQGAAQLTKTDAELGAQSKAKRRILRNIFNIVDDMEDEGLSNGWMMERLEWFDNCRNLDELKKVFQAAFNEAKQNKDSRAMLALVEANDKRKAALR